MRWVNKSDLSELTGVSWKTVKKRLDESAIEPNADGLYPSDRALRAVLEPQVATDAVLDLTAERARLASEQADRVAMMNAERKREMVSLTLVASLIAKQCRPIASIFDGVVPMLRRASTNLTASDLELVERELTRARNLASQLHLKAEDFNELVGDPGGSEGGLSDAGEVEPVAAESMGR